MNKNNISTGELCLSFVEGTPIEKQRRGTNESWEIFDTENGRINQDMYFYRIRPDYRPCQTPQECAQFIGKRIHRTGNPDKLFLVKAVHLDNVITIKSIGENSHDTGSYSAEYVFENFFTDDHKRIGIKY